MPESLTGADRRAAARETRKKREIVKKIKRAAPWFIGLGVFVAFGYLASRDSYANDSLPNGLSVQPEITQFDSETNEVDTNVGENIIKSQALIAQLYPEASNNSVVSSGIIDTEQGSVTWINFSPHNVNENAIKKVLEHLDLISMSAVTGLFPVNDSVAYPTRWDTSERVVFFTSSDMTRPDWLSRNFRAGTRNVGGYRVSFVEASDQDSQELVGSGLEEETGVLFAVEACQSMVAVADIETLASHPIGQELFCNSYGRSFFFRQLIDRIPTMDDYSDYLKFMGIIEITNPETGRKYDLVSLSFEQLQNIPLVDNIVSK